MAYSELIKNFRNIREYVRDFYVYGYKIRSDYDGKSLRSYDNERRRIESWLGKFVSFKRTEKGKNIFLSVDTQNIERNPLFKVFRTKSFTWGDITLHFFILDILHNGEKMTLNEIAEKIDSEYLCCFEKNIIFDMATIRNKLKEYCEMGILNTEKKGRNVYFFKEDTFCGENMEDLCSFFSEVYLCGVIGDFINDRFEKYNSPFVFKHHYIDYVLESEIIWSIFNAIRNKNTVKIKNKVKGNEKIFSAIPLEVFVSVQSGRIYIMCYSFEEKRIRSFRADYITDVIMGNKADRFDEFKEKLNGMKKHIFGVCTKKRNNYETVQFTIHIDDNEEFIYKRLEREKRCGTVERKDKNTCVYRAEVYDSTELIPWIRTYICRITEMNFSNRTVENYFKKDIELMYKMYGIGDSDHDIQ